jgi:hypothetical protein
MDAFNTIRTTFFVSADDSTSSTVDFEHDHTGPDEGFNAWCTIA